MSQLGTPIGTTCKGYFAILSLFVYIAEDYALFYTNVFSVKLSLLDVVKVIWYYYL